MGLTQVSKDGVKNDAIDASKLPANSIGASELADNAVDTNAIADQAVALSKLPHGDGNSNGKFLRANNGADPSFETVSIPDADRIVEGNSVAEVLDTGTNGIFRFLPEGSEVFRITHEGKIGIGTTNPSNMLHLSGTDPIIQFTDTAGGDSFGFFASASNYLGIHNFTDSRTDMVIDGSGKVGIGTNAPDDTLHVAGNIINTTSVSGTGDSGFQIANNHRLGFDQSGTRSWSVKATGGVLKIDSGDGNSAPQVRGILFGSDTADANKLNDYEEGTHSFTDASGASLSMSGSMIYTKIGRLVKVMFDISYPSTSSSANASVTLPFSASVAYGTGVVGWCSDPTFLHVANNTVSFMKNSASNSKHKSNSEVSGERFIGECSFFTNA